MILHMFLIDGDQTVDQSFLTMDMAQMIYFSSIRSTWMTRSTQNGSGSECTGLLANIYTSIPCIDIWRFRRTHAKEYAERERKRCLKAARRAEEAARRAETKKLQKASEERRIQKKIEREMRRREAARIEYDARWKELSSKSGGIGRDMEL